MARAIGDRLCASCWVAAPVIALAHISSTGRRPNLSCKSTQRFFSFRSGVLRSIVRTAAAAVLLFFCLPATAIATSLIDIRGGRSSVLRIHRPHPSTSLSWSNLLDKCEPLAWQRARLARPVRRRSAVTHSNLKGHIRSAICVRASAVTRRRQRSNLDLWIPVPTTRLLRSNRLDEFTPPSRQSACAMRRADSRPWFGSGATLAPPQGYRVIWSCPTTTTTASTTTATIAPTATIANIAGVYPCAEPAFKNIYMKEIINIGFKVGVWQNQLHHYY